MGARVALEEGENRFGGCAAGVVSSPSLGVGAGRKLMRGIAGATQVKWNRRQPHLIASAHDNRVLIWDERVRLPCCSGGT